MAGIDKTYVTWEEYQEIVKFFTKKVFRKQKRDIGFNTYLYEWTKESFEEDKELPIWNTSSLEDIWLAQNCNIECIQRKLKRIYSEKWIGFIPNLDFKTKGFIFDIDDGKSFISPIKELKNKIKVYSKLLVYGTTFAHKILYKAKSIIRGEFYYNYYDKDFIEIRFVLFGIDFKYVCDPVTKKESYTLTETGEEVEWGYFPRCWVGKDYFYKLFIKYEIKHSYKFSDYYKYDPEQIIMSDDEDCITVDMYKDFDLNRMNRYISLLPDYIKIKY